MNVAVLASGAGTNLQALLDRVHGREGIEIVAVASDKPDARALERARDAGVSVRAFPAAEFAGRVERDRAMADWLGARGVDLVVLAGYMQLLAERSSPASRARDQRPPRVAARVPRARGGRAGDRLRGQSIRGHGALRRRRGRYRTGDPPACDRAARRRATPTRCSSALHPIEHELLPEAVRLIALGAVSIDPANPRRVVIER